MDLISIVVPVYNVSEYICKCVDSIVSQTYKNIEIILVDDGSTDNSGYICDQYAKSNGNIKVIHKENGGLSSARNAGIDIAQGDYIGFVDSDDFISIYMYEILYKMIKKDDYDIAICNFSRNECELITQTPYDFKEEVLKKEDAFLELCTSNKFQSHAWTKLYKLELFNDIRYPEGKTYEDIYTTYKLMDKCFSMIYTAIPLYYYRDNPNSICNTCYKKSDLNLIQASEELYVYLNKNFPNISVHQRDSITRSTIGVLRKICKMNKVESEDKKYLISELKKGYPRYLKSQYKLSSKAFGAMVLATNGLILNMFNMLNARKR